MFQTFSTVISDYCQLDNFLNSLVSRGWYPVMVREFHRPVWRGYPYGWVPEAHVVVTAQAVSRLLPEVVAVGT